MAKGQFRMLRSHVAGVTAVEAETRHVFPRHTHEQYGIGVIDRGAHRSRSGRGVVEAGAGDVITVNPGEVHDGAPIGDAGRAWRMLYLDPSVVASAIQQISARGTGDCAFHHPVMRQPGTAARFGALFPLVTAEECHDVEIRCEESLLLLLGSALRQQQSNLGAKSFPSAIFRARALIDDDPAASVTLSDLARESGLSRFQVVRGFARATGMTPHAYLLQRRIHLARQLIAGGQSLADAALASGFADQSHMTRIFVRAYGVSPGAYAAVMI